MPLSYYGFLRIFGTLRNLNVTTFEELYKIAFLLVRDSNIDSNRLLECSRAALARDGKKVYNRVGNIIAFMADYFPSPKIVPYTRRILEILQDEGFVKSNLLIVPYGYPSQKGPSDPRDCFVWDSLCKHARDIQDLESSQKVPDSEHY